MPWCKCVFVLNTDRAIMDSIKSIHFIFIIMQTSSATELILIRITGEDRPGLTASVMEILAKYDTTILDIGQADIHSTLSLGILCKTGEAHSGFIMKELLFKASALGVSVRFYPVSAKEYEDWVGMQGKNRYILTLLGRKLSARQIAAATRILAEQGMNIDAIKRLTGRIPLNETAAKTKACIEFSVRGTPKDREQMQAQLMKMASELEMDFSFQLDNMYRRMRRLICFDMDSTLIKTEVMDELAECAGVGAYVRQITERAMNGEFDFKESFRQRLRLLQGLDEHVLQEIADRLPLMDGLETLLQGLKRHGCKVAILSGGFTYFALRLKEMFHLDYVYANQLEIRDGRLTGKHLGDIVDSSRKVALLKELSQKEQITLNETLAVGDGANDLAMLQTAGLGIAYHAKKKVRDHIPQSINITGLDGILYFLGYSPAEL